MIRTLVEVARAEGLGSVVARAMDRMVGPRPRCRTAPIVNVLTTRWGGVAVQLRARLAEERRMREVVLCDRAPIEATRAVIVDGAFDGMPALPDVDRVLVVHDFSLLSANPQEMELDARRVEAARTLLGGARAVIFPSTFLRDRYSSVLQCNAHVIEPGIMEDRQSCLSIAKRSDMDRQDCLSSTDVRVAFAGDVRPHKGAALLPEIIRLTPGAEWHVFGGGDAALLRVLRSMRNVRVHGYYRAGSLPRLLARHRIGLAVLPSLFLETFSLTLSECWYARVPVVAFDRSAIAQRIREHGGGCVVPFDEGAAGIAARVAAWLRGELGTGTIACPPLARDAAKAHVALYRELGIL